MKVFDDPKSKVAGLALGAAVIGAGLSMAWDPLTDSRDRDKDRVNPIPGAVVKALFNVAGAGDLIADSRHSNGAASLLDLLK